MLILCNIIRYETEIHTFYYRSKLHVGWCISENKSSDSIEAFLGT